MLAGSQLKLLYHITVEDVDLLRDPAMEVLSIREV